jgi:integrating conjugative element protein (TIGR03749 family)
MKKPLPVLAALVLSLGFVSPGSTVELLRWRRLPLAVPLVVGEERVVFVDRKVRVGMPSGVGERLRVQSAGGAIYLLAFEPIEPVRLQLQDVDSGALILLDVAAEEARDGQAPPEPVRIVEEDEVQAKGTRETPGTSGTEPPRPTPVPVILTRYAAQSLYAPLRTVEPVAGIGRVKLRRDLPLDTLLPGLPVRTRALAAWRLADQWVTAVLLANVSSHWLDLDPRELTGDFVAATFQHPQLGPAGDATDTTVVYLVTRGHGLAESLLPAIAPIDAAVNLPRPEESHDE